MPITVAQFIERFPEFASVDAGVIQGFIDDATLEMDSVLWGIYYQIGMFYLVAHELQLSLNSAIGINKASGMITAQAVGDTSVSFTQPPCDSNTDAYYQQTVYGLRYLKYINLIGGGGLTAHGSFGLPWFYGQ